MADLIIETSNLRKVYPSRGGSGTVEAVRDITFSVEAGEMFGLLGPNGAGKTTTMRMLSTLVSPTSGMARVVGFDLKKQSGDIRKQIGYVSQVGGMEREATGRENLLLQARLYGMNNREANARVEELLDLLSLGAFADRRTTTYSGGQRRLFDIASGIVHRPKLLFLDEPSTGLDPQNRAHVWEQVKKLNAQGTSMFLTTHYLDEADALCNRVAIVDHGQIVAMGSPLELKRQVAGDTVSLGFASVADVTRAAQALGNQPYIKESKSRDETLHLYVERGDEHLPAIMQAVAAKQIAIKNVQLSRPSLDDVFLKLTGRSLREPEE